MSSFLWLRQVCCKDIMEESVSANLVLKVGPLLSPIKPGVESYGVLGMSLLCSSDAKELSLSLVASKHHGLQTRNRNKETLLMMCASLTNQPINW